MDVYHGAAKYIMKSAATFAQQDEHWYELLGADTTRLATVCMTADQAKMSAEKMNLTPLSPADYMRMRHKHN